MVARGDFYAKKQEGFHHGLSGDLQRRGNRPLYLGGAGALLGCHLPLPGGVGAGGAALQRQGKAGSAGTRGRGAFSAAEDLQVLLPCPAAGKWTVLPGAGRCVGELDGGDSGAKNAAGSIPPRCSGADPAVSLFAGRTVPVSAALLPFLRGGALLAAAAGRGGAAGGARNLTAMSKGVYTNRAAPI